MTKVFLSRIKYPEVHKSFDETNVAEINTNTSDLVCKNVYWIAAWIIEK